MSSSAQQDSSKVKQAVIPTKGTPEYEAYYYKQMEDSVYRAAAMYLETFPESNVAKGWLSLNPILQRTIISSFLPVKFDPNDIDIEVENKEELDFTTAILFSCRVLDRTRKPPTTKNSLLKSAILYSSTTKQVSK